jgi:hypothetical protein
MFLLSVDPTVDQSNHKYCGSLTSQIADFFELFLGSLNSFLLSSTHPTIQTSCSFQIAEEVQHRKIRLLAAPNLYFVQYSALSKVETF